MDAMHSGESSPIIIKIEKFQRIQDIFLGLAQNS